MVPSADKIRTVLDACGKKEVHAYASAFCKKNKAEPGIGWELLQDVFNFGAKYKDPVEPFCPMLVTKDGRSMIPQDLCDAQLDAFNSTLAEIGDSEFRARVGDVLWIRRRDHDAARIAVEGYLESGRRLEDPKHWVSSMNRYERAVRLARQIEPNGELPKRALSHLEERVRHYDGTDPSFFTCKALEILVEFHFGDFPALANIAACIAAKARSEGDFRRARTYFDVQANLHRLAKDENGAEVALVAFAECFVDEAEARESGGSFLAARFFWEGAIKAFRNRPSLRARISELQRRLVIAGKRTRDEMTSVSHEVDIREMVEAAEAAFTGLPLDDALCKLALFVSPIDPSELREATLQSVKDAPLHALINKEIFDEAGRKIAHIPGLSPAENENNEPAIEGLMDEWARFLRGITVAGSINPAMRKIREEHKLKELDIGNLIFDSGFIPENREILFQKAIFEGFQFEFSTALHIFVPQVKNSLRYVLEQGGVSCRNVKIDGVEEVWSVERVLQHPRAKEIFGDSLVYELQSLLAGRLGPNLRNCIAHGLLAPAALKAESAVYLWWLLYRITLLTTTKLQTFVERNRAAKDGGGEANNGDNT